MEEKIKKFIADIIAHPLANIYETSIEIFGDNILPESAEINLVIPELAGLFSVKRKLVKDIVFAKTNYRIAATKDAFLNNTTILIDKTVK